MSFESAIAAVIKCGHVSVDYRQKPGEEFRKPITER